MEYVISRESADERVRRGTAWLDENYPGWRDKVEVNSFDITSTCDCVLGQLFESEAIAEDMTVNWDGLRGMGFEWVRKRTRLLSDDELHMYGFDSPHFNSEEDFAYLQESWTAVLKGEELNMWGTPKSDINSDEFCPECERVVPFHYEKCPTRVENFYPVQ